MSHRQEHNVTPLTVLGSIWRRTVLLFYSLRLACNELYWRVHSYLSHHHPVRQVGIILEEVDERTFKSMQSWQNV